jgi:hypothetical protein
MAYLSISIEHILDVTARKLVQLLVAGKHNHGDLRTTQHGQLESLLEKTILALEKRHLFQISNGSEHRSYCSIAVILDRTNLDLFSAHGMTIAIAW